MRTKTIHISSENRETARKILFFLLRLLIVFFIFDFFFLFLIAAPVEGGIYIPLLEKYNLAQMFRDMLLQGGGAVAALFGYEYNILGDRLSIAGGSGVIVGYSCYGFSIISLYIALIASYPHNARTKAVYLAAGLLSIVALNMLRIGGLAIVFTEANREGLVALDHHLVFNIIVYALIFAIFYRFVNVNPSNKGER